MSEATVFFHETLSKVRGLLVSGGVKPDDVVVIRDIFGRIRVAIDQEEEKSKGQTEALKSGLQSLGSYAVPGERAVLYRRDMIDPAAFFGDKRIVLTQIPGSETKFRLLDLQIVGQDWLSPESPAGTDTPPRLVFYGFKGGVGRSTALAILALHLANQGKRVLLIDLDLESPGLSSLLLPPENQVDFGLVDWFVEDAVGQGDKVIRKLVAASPLGQQTQGAIRVAAASGHDTENGSYLPKLARVYADINRDGKVERFAARVHRLITALEALEKPDVVLIDSRAGLHDLAAISIVGLSTFSYLFATGSAQSWQGLRFLFSHWQAYPDVLKRFRDRLVMVNAMFPKTEQASRATQFLEKSYTLFSETIYEETDEGDGDEDVFNYDLNDEFAPHYPVRILWDERLQEFDPLLRSADLFDETFIQLTFGKFLNRVDRDLEGLKNE